MGKGLEFKVYTAADPEYQERLKNLKKEPLRYDMAGTWQCWQHSRANICRLWAHQHLWHLVVCVCCLEAGPAH
jgi:hypothetical protein